MTTAYSERDLLLLRLDLTQDDSLRNDLRMLLQLGITSTTGNERRASHFLLILVESSLEHILIFLGLPARITSADIFCQ